MQLIAVSPSDTQRIKKLSAQIHQEFIELIQMQLLIRVCDEPQLAPTRLEKDVTMISKLRKNLPYRFPPQSFG
jgi:hypothetical protein